MKTCWLTPLFVLGACDATTLGDTPQTARDFDPARVYLIGQLQAGDAPGAVVDLETLDRAWLGLPAGVDRERAVIRPDGRLLFVEGSSGGRLMAMGVDQELEAGGAAAAEDLAANDSALATPACPAQVARVRVWPEDGAALYHCWLAESTWYDGEGETAAEACRLQAVSRDGDLLCSHAVLAADGSEHPLERLFFGARARPGGGFWVVADHAGWYGRFRVDAAGAVALEVALAPLPEDMSPAQPYSEGRAALDGAGRLVAFARFDARLQDTAVVRLSERGAELLYDEAAQGWLDPRDAALVTGP